MRNVGGALGFAAMGVLVGAVLAGDRAAGQEPAPVVSPVVCQTFFYGGDRQLVSVIASEHATKVKTWLDQQAAAGHATPVYRASVVSYAPGTSGVPATTEVVCVR